MLVERSAHWVAPQDLEQRIKDALDNPVALHPASSTMRGR